MASNWDKYSHMEEPQLTFLPISLMDDDTLISSAAMRRDGSMNLKCRLLNSQWLAQNNRNTFFGGSAINQFLKAGLKDFWNKRFGGNLKGLAYTNRFLQEDLTYIGNYAIDVSQDRVMVGVRVNF